MDKVPTDDYTQGQMMGMLCMIRLLRTSQDQGIEVPENTLDNIERIATHSLAEYLQTPEEDVILIIDRTLTSL